MICGRAGIREAYLTGRGRVKVRARMETEVDARGRNRSNARTLHGEQGLLEKIPTCSERR